MINDRHHVDGGGVEFLPYGWCAIVLASTTRVNIVPPNGFQAYSMPQFFAEMLPIIDPSWAVFWAFIDTSLFLAPW